MKKSLFYAFVVVVLSLFLMASCGQEKSETPEPDTLGIPVVRLADTSSTSVTVAWDIVANAASYEVMLNDDANLIPVTDTEYEVPTPKSGTYAVRVRALPGEGSPYLISDWSASVEYELGSDYDRVLNAGYMTGVYYGDIYGLNGEHCYNLYLSDKPMDGSYFTEGGTYYLFDIFTSAPEDSTDPLPTPGVYRLGEMNATSEMTFTPELSCIYYQKSATELLKTTLEDGMLTISADGDNSVFDAVLTDADGKTHHVTYSGPVEYVQDETLGNELSPLDRDLDFRAVLADALWLDDAGDGTMAVNLVFSDMESDQKGYVIPPGSILYIEVLMPFDGDGNLTPGTYDFTVPDGKPGCIYPGEAYELEPGYFMPMGTYADYIVDFDEVYTGLIDDGAMIVSGTSDNLLIECTFSTVEGRSVHCVFSGSLVINNMRLYQNVPFRHSPFL